jgi:hypothetical protein
MPRKMVRSSGPVQHLARWRAVDALDVLHRHRLHHVDFAGQQRGDAGGVVADRGEDHFLRVAVDLAPVVAVAHEGGAHVRLALAQAERAGAVGAERGRVLDALAAVDRPRGLVLLAPLLAQDVGGGELVRQDGERRLGLDLDGVVVDLAHFLDVVDVALQVGAFAGGALEREDDVVGGERRAVVELHALAQLEAPDGGRGLLPGGGQRGARLRSLLRPTSGS